MTKAITILLQIFAVAGGIGLGFFLKSDGDSAAKADNNAHQTDVSADESDGDEHKETDSKSTKKKKSESGHKKPKGHSDELDKSGDSDSSFMKFSRQFIVPVVDGDGVSALVVLDINLELSSSAKEDIYTREPKIRDALLSRLLSLSNEGAFNEQLLQPANIEEIRAALLSSAQSILGDDVIGVLILNVARQDL